ncbi:MAG: efflux RND transporter periplasmic adaptor subunit [Bacteroidales bacterium]
MMMMILIPGILLTYSCGNKNHPGLSGVPKFCIPDSLLRNLTFDTLRSEQVQSDLVLSGKIECIEDKVSRVYPFVSGHVSDVKVSLGDFVEKGKVLAVIESPDMVSYFDEYKSAQSELTIATKNLEVTTSMRNSGVTSEKDYLVAQNEYQKTLSQFNKMKEVLKINGSTLAPMDSTGARYVIKAPISGFIVSKNITPGMDIRSDANDFLFTISDLKEVWATANVYETDISKIQVNYPADVTTLSYPDKKFSGRIDRISNVLDPDTKVMSLKINIANNDFSLKPGMFAHITIHLPLTERMLVVKNNSIIYDESKSYLLRYRGKCDVSIQQVDIFKSFDNSCYIKSDSLKTGDVAIARDGLFIYTALLNF